MKKLLILFTLLIGCDVSNPNLQPDGGPWAKNPCKDGMHSCDHGYLCTEDSQSCWEPNWCPDKINYCPDNTVCADNSKTCYTPEPSNDDDDDDDDDYDIYFYYFIMSQ